LRINTAKNPGVAVQVVVCVENHESVKSDL
jgi:hypothetical protein